MEKLKIVPVNYPDLGERIAEILGVEIIYPEVIDYPTGCTEVRLPKEVRNCSAFVTLTGIPDLTLLPRHILITQLTLAAVYESFATRIVLVMSYYGYARSDKKEGRMTIAAKRIAQSFLQATDGHTDTIVFDLHSPQVEGYFGRIDNPSIFKLLIPLLRQEEINPQEVIVLPDDAHARKRADLVARCLGCSVGSVEKRRLSPEKVVIDAVHGDYRGKGVIIATDEVCTGGSVRELLEKIGNEIKWAIVVAAHGLFVGNAISNLSHPKIRRILVSNTLPIRPEARDRLPLVVADIAPFLASMIKAIHQGEKLSPFYEIE